MLLLVYCVLTSVHDCRRAKNIIMSVVIMPVTGCLALPILYTTANHPLARCKIVIWLRTDQCTRLQGQMDIRAPAINEPAQDTTKAMQRVSGWNHASTRSTAYRMLPKFHLTTYRTHGRQENQPLCFAGDPAECPLGRSQAPLLQSKIASPAEVGRGHPPLLCWRWPQLLQAAR